MCTQQGIKKSFRNKLLRSLLVLTLLPLIIWGMLSYRKALENRTDALEQGLRETTEGLRLRVDQVRSENSDLMRQLAHDIAHRPRQEWRALLVKIAENDPSVLAQIDN